jgi:hypothetical protein
VFSIAVRLMPETNKGEKNETNNLATFSYTKHTYLIYLFKCQKEQNWASCGHPHFTGHKLR